MRRIALQARWKICQSLDVKQTPPPGFRFCNLARKHPAWSPYHKLYVQRFWYQADDARKYRFFTMKIVPFFWTFNSFFILPGRHWKLSASPDRRPCPCQLTWECSELLLPSLWTTSGNSKKKRCFHTCFLTPQLPSYQTPAPNSSVRSSLIYRFLSRWLVIELLSFP